MYYINIQSELAQLSLQLQSIHVTDAHQCIIRKTSAMTHWQDIVEYLESMIAEERLWIELDDLNGVDIYILMDQEIIYKNLCLEITYLLRLGYDLGIDRSERIELYHRVLNLWFGYADLLCAIQVQGKMQGIAALILDVDYAVALLLMTCAIAYDDTESVVKIVDGLLHYQSDRLLDILSYPYFENATISDEYRVNDPYQDLDSILNTANQHTISAYLSKISHDQDNGQYFEKKKFHKLMVLGQWSFEIYALVAVYQIDAQLFKGFKSYPYEF